MRTNLTWSVLCCAYLGLLGPYACGKKDSKSAGSGASTPATSGASGTAPVGFLQASALTAPTLVSVLDGSDAVSALVSSDDFYDNAPAPASTSCLDTTINNLTLTGSDTALTASSTSDVTSCYNTVAGVNFSSASLQYLVYAACPSGGLSSFVGKTVGALTGANACPTSYQQMSQLEIQAQNANITGTVYGVASQFLVNSAIISYYGSGTAVVPCDTPVNGGVGTTSDCLSVDMTVTTYLDNASGSLYHNNSYTTASAQNVVSNDNGTTVWPTSGSFTVVANNWSGTVTAEGPSSLPTYVLTAQASGSTVSGTFPASSATASLRLLP